jgi:hypothetical protein
LLSARNAKTAPTMTSSSASSIRIAAVAGMVVGSAVTVAVMRYLAPAPRENENDKTESNNRNITTNTLGASLSGSTEDSIEQDPKRVQLALAGDASLGADQFSFMSSLLEQMWSHLRIAGAEKIRAAVEPYFQDFPGPLKQLRFTKIDLGNIPIRMDHIVVHDIHNGQIQMDLTISWDGDCDIQLGVSSANVEAAATAGTSIYRSLAFGVQSIKLQGRMAIVFQPLTNELPIISGIQYSFINPPTLDLNFTGLANVADWSMLNLDQTVRDILHSSLLCMVLPNRSLYKMMSNNNYLETYQPPLGVARISVVSGRGFAIEKKKLLGKDDIPDVYCNISLGTSEVWRTRTIQNGCNPVWGDDDEDYGEFLVDDREQWIRVHAWDEDRGMLNSDDDMGMATISLRQVLLSKGQTVELPLLFHTRDKKDLLGQPTGAFITIRVELCEWTTALSSLKQARSTRNLLNGQFENEDGGKSKKNNKTENKNSSSFHAEDHRIGGLLAVVISRAIDISIPRHSAATFCKVTYGSNEFETSIIKEDPGYNDGLNPVYDAAFRVPLTPHRMQNALSGGPTASLIKLELYQSHDGVSTTTTKVNTTSQKKSNGLPITLLGSTTVDFSELARAPNNTISELRALGNDSTTTRPSLEFRMSLSGVRTPPSTSMYLSLRQLTILPGTPTQPTGPTSATRHLGSPSEKNNTDDNGLTKSNDTVRVTVVKAQGLQIQQGLFNIDVPDVYCLISLLGETGGASSTTVSSVWRTKTVHNSCTPEWNETRDLPIQDHGQILNVELWDSNKREYDPDQYIGCVQLSIGKLLLTGGGAMDVPIESINKGVGPRGSNVQLTLKCEMV